MRPVVELYEWATWFDQASPLQALYPPEDLVAAPVFPHW
jgi:hypothetical protein